MSEHPSTIAREAKCCHQALKDLLKNREPYDKEVDFQRKNLRRRYLTLLLVHSNAPEAKDAENHLWMQTSYTFISAYKQSIATLDRNIQNNQKQIQQQQQTGSHGRQNPHHGVVEHRKLVQRFKQFLAEEEKFWTQLILRLLRLFDLREARPVLIDLGILTESDDGVTAGDNGESGGAMQGANGRNHFQFPPEDPSVHSFAKTTEERETQLGKLSKALICLGDIARYREHYNESNGRPRAGQDELIPARRGRGRRGGGPEGFVRPRNYEKAQQCYERARQLVPYEGNPSHQLAILANYKKDIFSSIIHYYRSLCVRQPYDTAAENLGTVLSKALDNWRQKVTKERDTDALDPSSPLQPIHIRVDLFKEQVVVLHSLWRVGLDKGINKMASTLPRHNDKVSQSFFTLVSQRHLPDTMITNTVVLSQGAVWKHRMFRDPQPSRPHRQNGMAVAPDGTETQMEWAILDHLLDLHFSLLEVGKDELKDPPQTDLANDLAQRISATFRRTLPALRIASKWLRANLKYLSRDKEFLAFQTRERMKGVEIYKSDPTKISGYSTKTIRFWKAYAVFMALLSQSFPKANLPKIEGPLDEDIEMRGFAPLQGCMVETKKADTNGVPEKVHPNDEQLMRISDLFVDAKALAELENSPLQIIKGNYGFKSDIVEDVRLPSYPEMQLGTAIEPTVPVPQQHLMANIRDLQLNRDQDVDAMTELTSRTDDDPVRDAFQFLNAAEDSVYDEFEEDEVVYMRASVSPTLSPKAFATPATPARPLLSPKSVSPRSPTTHQTAKSPLFGLPATLTPAIPTTTAQDLLNDVLGNHRRRGSLNHPTESTAPQSTFLFGSELSHRPSQSIWSASRDEQPLMYSSTAANGHGIHTNNQPHGAANKVSPSNVMYTHNQAVSAGLGPQSMPATAGGQLYQTGPTFQAAQPPDPSLSQQSMWSSSIDSSQNSQHNLVAGLPSAPFAQPPQIGLGHGLPQSGLTPFHHNRIPSGPLSLPLNQLYASPAIELQSDQFVYSSPVLHQTAIHRPEPSLPPPTGYLGSTLLHGSLPAIGEGALGGSLIGGSVGPGQPYYTSPGPGQHSRHVSIGEGRGVGPQNYFTQPNPLAWGNTG